MFILMPFQRMAQFLALMVMPRSRSMAPLSMIRSWTAPLRNKPLCLKSPSTNVVLPWSTCAMMAILRILSLILIIPKPLYHNGPSCSISQGTIRDAVISRHHEDFRAGSPLKGGSHPLREHVMAAAAAANLDAVRTCLSVIAAASYNLCSSR